MILDRWMKNLKKINVDRWRSCRIRYMQIRDKQPNPAEEGRREPKPVAVEVRVCETQKRCVSLVPQSLMVHRTRTEEVCTGPACNH